MIRSLLSLGLILLSMASGAANGTAAGLAIGIASGTVAGAVQMADTQCACLCVEGVPQTLCSSIEEARQRPGHCRLRHCPEYVAVEDGGRRYVAPDAYADNCRDVRIWDDTEAVYSGVKVCDVLDVTFDPDHQ